MTSERLTTELVAVLVAVDGERPKVLTVPGPDDPALPSGPLLADHRSLQSALRAWVQTQTGYAPGYVEQLYTFADSDRAGDQGRIISVSYLGLTTIGQQRSGWHDWYEFFPWEDHRTSAGRRAHDMLTDRLRHWARQPASAQESSSATVGPPDLGRWHRCAIAFGLDGHIWTPESCLQRYELLYEAGLIAESPHAGWPLVQGLRMRHDHRRILATGVARLRAKIQYRPVVFELLPEAFTLGQLQAAVEALAGTRVHKQNFRRLVEQQNLVEDTGRRDTGTGGRPAKLVRFRREVLLERQAAGTKLPIPRSR